MSQDENVRKWVSALRSGEFAQTVDHLRDRDGYCCLGVACEVYRRETGEGAWVRAGGIASRDALGFDVDLTDGPPNPNQIALPGEVRDWLGLETCDGDYLTDSGARAAGDLANLNDGGVPFDRIADLIESRPPGLFDPVTARDAAT